jgi:hypothetical protein
VPVTYIDAEGVAPIFAEVVGPQVGCAISMRGSIRHFCDLVHPSGAWRSAVHGDCFAIEDRLTFQRPRPWRAIFRFDLERMDCAQERRLKERALAFAESLGNVRNFFLGDVKTADMGRFTSVYFITYGQR